MNRLMKCALPMICAVSMSINVMAFDREAYTVEDGAYTYNYEFVDFGDEFTNGIINEDNLDDILKMDTLKSIFSFYPSFDKSEENESVTREKMVQYLYDIYGFDSSYMPKVEYTKADEEYQQAISTFMDIGVIEDIDSFSPNINARNRDLMQIIYNLNYIDNTFVYTPQGKLLGKLSDDEKSVSFMGVPFANAKRWSEPTSINDSEDMIDVRSTEDREYIAEGVLNANIYRPNTTESGLPIIFYVGEEEIDGNKLADATDSIVYIPENRTGIFGATNLRVLKSTDNKINSGNFALLDLNYAMDWVSSYIAYFGGNNEKITVMGNDEALAIMYSPIFEGKFDQAVIINGENDFEDEEKLNVDSVNVLAEVFTELGLTDSIDKATALLNSNEEADKELIEAWFRDVPNDAIYAKSQDFNDILKDGYVMPKVFNEDTYVSNVPVIITTDSSQYIDDLYNKFVEEGHIVDDVFTDDTAKDIYNFLDASLSDLISYTQGVYNADLLSEYIDFDSEIYLMEISEKAKSNEIYKILDNFMDDGNPSGGLGYNILPYTSGQKLYLSDSSIMKNIESLEEIENKYEDSQVKSYVFDIYSNYLPTQNQ